MATELHPNDPVNQVSDKILDAAFKIHRLYGPGLLENAYHHLMLYELTKTQGLKVESQKLLPLVHEGQLIEVGYKIDLLVEDSVIIELKACEKLLPVHQAQLLTYMKLMQKRLGLLMNFHSVMLKDGIKRLVL